MARTPVPHVLSTEQKIADLLVFGPLMIRTGDIDPLYPLLAHVAHRYAIEGERLLWLLYVYLAFYNVASAWQAFQEFPDPARVAGEDYDRLVGWEERNRRRLPINLERRGLRGGAVCKALQAWAELTAKDGQIVWLGLNRLDSNRTASYETLWTRVQEVPQVGRWAAFKWLELLKVVAGVPIEAPDLRMEYCSGPRKGLAHIYGVDPDKTSTADLDTLGTKLRWRGDMTYVDEKSGPSGRLLSWEELETLLCNFNSLAKGRYYVGHDIDEHLRDIQLLDEPDRRVWLDARAACFAPEMLGEVGGWSGIRHERLTLYRDRRVIAPAAVRTPV